jgi:hypothetical protein
VFAFLIAIRSVGWLTVGRQQNVFATVLGFRHFIAKRFGQAPELP